MRKSQESFQSGVTKMKILYVAPSIPVPGFHGGSTHVTELGRHLVKRGCTVVVIARRLPGQKFFELVDGIHVYRVWRGIFRPVISDFSGGSEKTAILANSAYKVFEKIYFSSLYLLYVVFLGIYLAKKYDVNVILERGDSYGIGALISMLLHKPLIVEVRDVYQPIISLLRAKLILTYDKSIIKTPTFRNKAVTMYGGVDTTKFVPLSNSRTKIFPNLVGKIVIGYAGSFTKTHRLIDIIKLAKKLYERYGDTIHFLMIGPYDMALLELIKRLNLMNIFTFTGAIKHEDLPAYISSMDIGIALYDPEMVAGPPYKVYEYMACGVPPVTTDTIFSRKIIINVFTGFLVRHGDLVDLYEKLCLLIENKDMRQTMGSRARAFIERFSWSNEAERILKILRKLLMGSKVIDNVNFLS